MEAVWLIRTTPSPKTIFSNKTKFYILTRLVTSDPDQDVELRQDIWMISFIEFYSLLDTDIAWLESTECLALGT